MASVNKVSLVANEVVSLHPRATDFVLITTAITQLEHSGDGSLFFNAIAATAGSNILTQITVSLLGEVRADVNCDLYYRIV